VQGPLSSGKNVKKIPVTVKIRTYSGCGLHKNAFCGRAPPGAAGGAILPPDPLAVIRIRGRGGREKGKGRP